MAMDPAAVPSVAQPPVIDLEPEPAVSGSSGKRALDLAAVEADTGKKRPRMRQAGSAGESHGESRLAAKEIPALPTLPIHPALPEEGKAVLQEEQFRLISQTWESGRDWRDETYKALTIRYQDALLSHRNADLVAEAAMKMETLQLELEAAVNQREVAKEALARETAQAWETLRKAVAQADADRAEFDRVKAGLEEALSRKETEANERAALLEAAAAQSIRDGEKIQDLETRVRELDSSLREEVTAHEEARRGKEQADDLLHVSFEEAIYMAWRKDKSMNLLIFPDPESKRAEFEAKEKEDVELLEDEA
ncbi:uncharacterized protein LOC133805943 [Humulus lupulus]|uniref:uncharacterized protein LOC133805943 n=1 Tax=Humulus lupulus TaxID=3486 RepID=UPI002B407832|nr:uncharacterized protein LOC133805943 [Humulus lupulus]